MKLVLEGGGIRAAYSAGVCQALDEAKIPCEVVIGSSSGALIAAFHAAGAAKQLGEQLPLVAPGFIRFGRLFNPFSGPALGVDELIDDVFIGPGILDVKAATSSKTALLFTATDVDTCEGCVGRPDANNLARWLKASLALPVAYNRVISIEGRNFIDGGVASPVPFDVPELDAFNGPTVVILTRASSTKKPAPSWWQEALIHGVVPKSAQAATLRQHELHNSVMQRLRQAKAEANVIVSEPPPEMPLSRLTKDAGRIREGVQIGIEVGRKLARQLKGVSDSQ